MSGDVERFVQQLAVYGCNRYFEHPVNTEWIGLPILDKTVWQIRKHCHADLPKRNNGELDGRLEEILSSDSRTRDDLVWKNIWFGRYKKTKFSRRVILANPSNFIYPEMKPDRKSWWLVIDGEKVDLCLTDPGYNVDLYVSCPLRTMTAVWMGMAKLNSEVEAGHIQLTGDRSIAKSMQQWLGLSPFAQGERGVG